MQKLHARATQPKESKWAVGFTPSHPTWPSPTDSYSHPRRTRVVRAGNAQISRGASKATQMQGDAWMQSCHEAACDVCDLAQHAETLPGAEKHLREGASHLRAGATWISAINARGYGVHASCTMQPPYGEANPRTQKLDLGPQEPPNEGRAQHPGRSHQE